MKTKLISFAIPLISFTLLVLILAFAIQSFLISKTLTREISETQKINFLMITQSVADILDLEIVSNESLLSGYAKVLSYNNNFIQENINTEVIETVLGYNHSFEKVLIANKKGVIIHSSDPSILGSNITEKKIFKELKQSPFPSSLSISQTDTVNGNNVTFDQGANIFHDGEFSGIIAVSTNLNVIGEELVLNKRVGATGYPYVAEGGGKLIIHPSDDLLSTNMLDIDPIFDSILKSSERIQYLGYSLNGSKKQGVFIKLENLDWVVCLAISDEEAFSTTILIRNLLIITSFVLAFGTSLFLFFFIRMKLVMKVNKIERLMALASEGDLKERGRLTGRDEISSMTSYFNNLLDSLSNYFSSLSGKMDNLSHNGSELSANMEETAAAVYQIRKNVDNSLLQIEKQESSVSTTVTSVEEITQNIQSLDNNIERQNDNIMQESAAVEEMISQIKTVSSSTEQAEKLMSILESSSVKGKDSISEVVSMVNDISVQSESLEQANSLISGIAARTNLLAMNAAIEAAHAGVAGRGFAVVADEIRKLAEQSTAQSTQVKQTINDINSRIQNVVEGSKRSNDSFEEIKSNIVSMGQVTTEIKQSLEEQVAGSTQVLESLEELKNFGREISSGSNEMTQGNQVILDSITQLTQISSEVALAIREIGNGIDEINKAVVAVSELSIQNKENIDSVREDTKFYKINDNSIADGQE